MATTTTDPIVALLYGTLAYPSLRPGVTTTVDLVAGQPGPWQLDDDDRANTAISLAARLAAEPSTTADDLLTQVLWDSVLDAITTAHRELYQWWESERDRQTPAALHPIVRLEEHLATFLTERGRAPGATNPTDASDVPELPSVLVGATWQSHQWIELIRRLDLEVQPVVAEMRARIEAAGLVPPASLRGVHGNDRFTAHLLEAIAHHAGPLSEAPDETVRIDHADGGWTANGGNPPAGEAPRSDTGVAP